MVNGVFEWEKPLVELEQRIAELQKFTREKGIDLSEDIKTLERSAERLRREIYANLTPWQRVQMARHTKRPTTLDYILAITTDFVELAGDKCVRDDQAIVGGIANIDGRAVTIIGPQKGRDTKENIKRNFGLPHPEGYRKALRLMRQAEKFKRPIITLIDVVGAYPGIEAEERGQGVVIAECIRYMSFMQVPIICIITGEGGSGGALAIGVGDRLLMLENSWYSVISPEMCAQILWKDTSRAADAAAVLHLTAGELTSLGVVDGILPEPLGGAHRDPTAVAQTMKTAIVNCLDELDKIPTNELVDQRLAKFRKIGDLMPDIA
jgi:acetyl-CoA carboxylase carboxyl transferase subunit alpha